MNIFYLDNAPQLCAQYHCDKHVVKMIIEYAQLMSTAHRLLDGYKKLDPETNKVRWFLDGDLDKKIYRASHMNHPSAIWVRQNESHYRWLYDMWCCLIIEYGVRYHKYHKTANLQESLYASPTNISKTPSWKEPPPAMPDECKIANDSIQSYRNYYIMKKSKFAVWKNGKIPDWFTDGVLSLSIM